MLVVTSTGFSERSWLDSNGHPHSDSMRLTESFKRIDFGRLELEVTIDDPGAYTAKYEGGFNLGYNENQELFEYVCQQANYAHELMVGGESRAIDRSSPIIP